MCGYMFTFCHAYLKMGVLLHKMEIVHNQNFMTVVSVGALGAWAPTDFWELLKGTPWAPTDVLGRKQLGTPILKLLTTPLII